MQHSIEAILHSSLIESVKKTLFGEAPVEIIKRPGSFIIRKREESKDKTLRIILLPPKGFTGDRAEETNPHPEVRMARIEVKGGITPKSIRFRLLKNAVRYQFYTVRGVETNREEPYPDIHGAHYLETIKSSREKFYVVKENGVGFYHSIVNISNEWVVLLLHKEMRLQKQPHIESKTADLSERERNIILSLYTKILLQGDALFKKEKALVDEITHMNAHKALPALIEMLNVLETGKHEPCTVFAIILKMGRKDKEVIPYLKAALEQKIAPHYYLEELIKKLENKILKRK